MKHLAKKGMAVSLLLTCCIASSNIIASPYLMQPDKTAETAAIVETSESASLKQLKEKYDLEAKLSSIKKCLMDKNVAPQVGSVGGEWLIIGLERYGEGAAESYASGYYNTLESYVKAAKGVLSTRKYTEYSRVVLAVTALKKDPANVGGYNLLTPLGDYDAVVKQGINGPIFALIALDSKNYEMPICKTAKTQATREMYLSYILNKQGMDGGFGMSETSNADVTAMALVALAPYKEQEKVQTAINGGLKYLSTVQTAAGGYLSDETENVESAAQVLLALNALGISYTDTRFVKNGHNLIDNILSFYKAGEGFYHTKEMTSVDAMASEQAFYSLVSTWRVENGQSSLFEMND